MRKECGRRNEYCEEIVAIILQLRDMIFDMDQGAKKKLRSVLGGQSYLGELLVVGEINIPGFWDRRRAAWESV